MIHPSKHAKVPGRILILGFGSIGQGVLPLILRHLDVASERITIISADEQGHAEAQAMGVKVLVQPVTRGNYRQLLEPLVGEGDFLVNVSVDVSSVALIELCRERGALYLDTCVEPWAGAYVDPTLSPSERSNYALRESALRLKEGAPAPTAVITHGANPGLVSHFVKVALLNIASRHRPPRHQRRHAQKPRRLGGAGPRPRRQGHPHRRARHPACRRCQEARRVRQHLVHRRLRQRGLPAGGTRLGHPRERLPRRRRPPRLRQRRRHLPQAPRRRHPGAHLDAAGGPLPRLPRHPQRVRSRSPTT